MRTRAPAPAKLLVSGHSVTQTPSLLEGVLHAQGTQRLRSAVTEEPKPKAAARMERIRQAQRGKSFIHSTFIYLTHFPEPRYAMRQARCRDRNPGCPTEPSRQP